MKFDGWRGDRREPELKASFTESMRNAIGLRWKRKLGIAPIRCSPIIGYGKVFIGTDSGKILALNPTTGRIRWTYHVGGKISTSPRVQKLMGVEYPMLWFTAEDGYLYALNAENGNFLWKLAGSGLPGNSGVTVQVPRTVFYNCRLEPNSSKTRAVNALTGQIIWESGSHNLTTATPLVIHFLDMLIQGVAQGGRNVRAYRTTNGDNLWNISTPGTHSSCYTSGVFGAYDRLSISTKDGSVRVYNVHNQHLIWEKNLPDAREIFGFALKQQIGGEILIITTLNDIYCLKAATGELLWHVNHRGNLIDEFRRTPMPAVYGGLVIHVEDGQKLTVRRLKNGEEVWHFHLDGTVISSPALSDRCIFIGTQAGTFYSFYSCHY